MTRAVFAIPPAPRTGLPPRRLAAALVVAVIALALAAGLAIQGAVRGYQRVEEARLRAASQALAEAADALLAGKAGMLQTVAEALRGDAPAGGTTRDRVLRGVERETGGRIAVLGTSQGDDGLPPETAGAIRALAGRLRETPGWAVSDLLPGPTPGSWLLALVVAAPAEEQGDGVLALLLDIAGLRRLLLSQDMPAQGFAAIADGALRVIAHSADPEGQRTGAPAPDWVADAIRGRSRALVVGPGWSGMPNVYAVERLDTAPGWTLTVVRPEAAIRAASLDLLRLAFIAAAPFAGGVLVVAMLWRRASLLSLAAQADRHRAARAELERLLDGLPAMVSLRAVRPDGSWRLLAAGGDVSGVSGWTREQIGWERAWNDHRSGTDPSIEEVLLAALRDGSTMVEWRMRRPDATWSQLRTQMRVTRRLPDGSGEVIAHTVNIGAERAADARALTTARLASVGEMATGIAHELKQPLTIISLAAENASRAISHGRGTGVAGRLDIIVDEVQRAGRIIEHLRRFARSVPGNPRPVPVALEEAVAGALLLARGGLAQEEATIEVDLGAPAPWVLGEAMAIEQILMHLLSNSRDALARLPAGAPRIVRITAVREEGADGARCVRITVADSGPGLEAEVLARLFEPFVTTKGPERGTGLGLSTCLALARDMGSAIEGGNGAQGAVFSLILPEAQPH